MKILVTNDDGIIAKGIRVLAEHLAQVAEVYVMAPDRNRSGASNSLTLHQPIRVREVESRYFSVEGTPTDCVHLALTGFFEFKFDMVVSGINDGANLGDDVLYSGTVAAAMEGHNLGLPAVAVSLSGSKPVTHFDTAANYIKHLISRFIEQPPTANILMNINVPNVDKPDISGTQVTRLGTRHNAEPFVKDTDPRGRTIYWIGSPGSEADAGPGTDFYANAENAISITPLHLDMTHYKIFEQVSHWTKDVKITV